MWVVDIIENCITLWNSTLSSIWSMLTQSPETFHNGAVWDAITKIFTALTGSRLRPARPCFICHEFL